MIHKFTILLVSLSLILSGCSSTTIIKSEPSGATLYINDMKVGKTPYIHTDSKIVGTSTHLKLKKDGYEDLNTVLSKNEDVNVGAIIGGLFVLVPFLWTMGYIPEHNYELENKTN